MSKEVHYHDYLQLGKILNAQSPISNSQKLPAHDEMLFIIVHQAYELWFRQLHHEINSVLEIMSKPSLNDNSPELQTVVHRLSRCVTIFRVLVHQVDILETMTPMDFLDFRDMLRPASGFQSWQFKELEAKLGLKFEDRHGRDHYLSQLREEHIAIIKSAEAGKSLRDWVNAWLERMPFFENAESWDSFPVSPEWREKPDHPFWVAYRNQYRDSLAEEEKNNMVRFDQILFGEQLADINRRLSVKASRAALFIMLYRGYPILQLPFQLLNNLLEVDEQLSSWRYRHMNMVHRMIGTRIGTGGSSGKDYLKAAADKHYIFHEIAQLTSFLIERKRLPSLPAAVEKELGFTAA